MSDLERLMRNPTRAAYDDLRQWAADDGFSYGFGDGQVHRVQGEVPGWSECDAWCGHEATQDEMAKEMYCDRCWGDA